MPFSDGSNRYLAVDHRSSAAVRSTVFLLLDDSPLVRYVLGYPFLLDTEEVVDSVLAEDSDQVVDNVPAGNVRVVVGNVLGVVVVDTGRNTLAVVVLGNA